MTALSPPDSPSTNHVSHRRALARQRLTRHLAGEDPELPIVAGGVEHGMVQVLVHVHTGIDPDRPAQRESLQTPSHLWQRARSAR